MFSSFRLGLTASARGLYNINTVLIILKVLAEFRYESPISISK